ncbi:MAG: glycosyltransferase family 4 protein [Chloroflexi bacterium]|nr:glycosyltransferase family 4 protein [Chloroflexota bacterium]
MKLVMFTINPLFPDQVMGGAQKHLKHIAIHLGELGHDVIVLCTQRADSIDPFQWHERVEVKPTFRFKQPFPGPYDTPAYNLAAAVQDMAEHLAQADRFYMHDGEYLFPFVYRHIPTVVSLRDNVYPETMLGSFLSHGDALIAISEYSRQFYLHTAGRFFPELKERAIVIHNGIDWERFKPTVPNEILNYVDVDPQRHRILLHPHRPEPSKGLQQTLDVVDLLVHQHGISNLKALIPQWLDVGISADLRAYYDDIRHQLAERNLTDHVVLHGWIPQNLMPQLYSLGDVMVSLGHFVESFGNTVYESLGCGTPAIAARISTHRELLPDDLLDKVHFDDADRAAAIAAEIIRTKRRTSPETMSYLHQYYGIERQLKAYADAILHTPPKGPMTYQFAPLDDRTRYRLSPWCYEWEGGFYHDFRANHTAIPALSSLIRAHPDGFTIANADDAKVPHEHFDRWYRQGYIAPAMDL